MGQLLGEQILGRLEDPRPPVPPPPPEPPEPPVPPPTPGPHPPEPSPPPAPPPSPFPPPEPPLGRMVRTLAERPVGVRRALALALALAVTAVGLGVQLAGASDGDTTPSSRPAVAVEAGARSVATATRPLVDVFADPTSAHAAQTLAHPTPSGAPLTFLVEAEWNGWLRVMLPGPPAGSRGWVAADQVELNEVDGNITIDLDQRRLVYERNGQAEVQIPVSVGYMDAPATGPTYVTEVLALSSRSETYGSHVLVLGGAANGPDQLYRGKDLVAVHGISDDALVGRQLPSGSVAVTSMDARHLAETVPAGTPVAVVGGGLEASRGLVDEVPSGP